MDLDPSRGFDGNQFVSNAHLYEAVTRLGPDVISMLYVEIYSFEERTEPGRVDA